MSNEDISIKTERKNKAKNVFLVLTIVFAAATVGLSIWLGISRKNEKNANLMLEARYQQAYYVLSDETSNMEITMSKLAAATTDNTRRELLYEIWKSSEVCASSLAALSVEDGTVTNTMRFVNQVGDFSLFLAKNLAGGDSITAEQTESLKKIRDMIKNLETELQKIGDEIKNGYLFIDGFNSDNNLLGNVLNGLNDASVEYPRLIYDGPFSDALDDKTALGLSGEDVSSDAGIALVNAVFEGKSVTDVSFSGDGNADIKTLNYNAKVDGHDTTVQLAKQGGMLLSFNTYREITSPSLNAAECSEAALAFLERNGFTGMQEVWIANDDNTYYINFVSVTNSVIVYPDMIKVKVACDNGDVLGFEARSYAFNHTTRTIASPKLSATEAKAALNFSGEVTNGRLCLIPLDGGEERLTYEFIAVSGGTYYVYLDANTAEEVNILYVISSTHGDLLV